VRVELPRNTGIDSDGIAQTEADHHMECPGAASGSICAIWPRSSNTSTMPARLNFGGPRATTQRACAPTIVTPQEMAPARGELRPDYLGYAGRAVWHSSDLS
jgi:hypothetical protein